MEKSDIQKGLGSFLESLNSDTFYGTYSCKSTVSKKSLKPSGKNDSTRANSLWKMAEYIIVGDDDSGTSLAECLQGWKALVATNRNQYLIIEETTGNWGMYDYDCNRLGGNEYIKGYLESHKCINDDGTKKSKQIIYYGAPGTGKSYAIDKMIHKLGVNDEQVNRVIFYPDYCYDDFIGGIQPVTDNAGKPTYKFVAGPFVTMLKDAVTNPDKSYFMLVEEINRGNAAAIFGDIFQLLDRASNGTSKYTITNKDIANYVYGDENKRVGLPSNLSILCTMNTADQNVFVLDSAFKRRFAMEYVPIDFSKLDPSNPNVAPYNDESSVFAGTKQIEDIFKNTDLQDYTNAVGTGLKRNWPTFAQIVNEKINIINKGGESISEDKKLGPFFVSIDEVHDRQKFADKVLYYLKQDVFKYVDTVLKPSYQKLYDDFVKNGTDIFELLAKTE